MSGAETNISLEAKATMDDPHTREELEKTVRDYLETVAELDAEAREYLDEGCLRNAEPLTAEQRELVEEMDTDIGFQAKQCYHNAQLAVSFYGGRTDIHVEYGEGYVLSNAVPVPIQHAWIELDGRVAEVTLPPERQSDEVWVYFGVAYDAETVRETIATAKSTQPLAGCNF
jgi:hypothetical protein